MSARDMFYPKGAEFSNADERAFAKEELVYNVTEDLLVILEDMEITKKELANRLGKSKSFVSQVLSGARNMTLGTLSDICFALEIKPKVVLPVGEAPKKVETKTRYSWEDVQSQHDTFKGSSTVVYRQDPKQWKIAA